jgi:dihydroxyacetone kinase
MSTKREEKAAFEKLKKAFPGRESSLTISYCSWRETQHYYATVNDLGSTCGEEVKTANEAVKLMIKQKEVKL